MENVKRLTLKNMIADYLNSYASDEIYKQLLGNVLLGYISRNTWTSFNDIVAGLYLDEENGIYKDDYGIVRYRRNEKTGYFEKVAC